MPHIFLVNSKGGSGKTTLSTQLASHYAKRGDAVILVDRDPQKSASDWLAARPARCANIQLISATPDQAISADSENSIVIHDMPAGWIPELGSPVFADKHAHKMLIPILPSPIDIKSGLRFIMMLYRSGILEKRVSAALIANRARAHIRFNKVLMEFLARVDLPLIGTVRDSQNYIRAMENGISIFDLPASAVKADLEQWQAIIDWLNIHPA